MRPNSNLKTIIFLLVTVIFMYQENIDAQPKKKKDRGKPPMIAEIAPVPPEVSYTVSMPKPWTHLLEVEMRVKTGKGMNYRPIEQFDIALPVWTPGSYLVREYARHVQEFSAKDSGGNTLVWSKTNKNTWSIGTKGVTEFIASYKVYANELTVRTNELNADHAFWNNGALLMFPKGFLNIPTTLTVKPYGDWKIATGLPKVGENIFKAESYDILYDSPFEVGNFKEIAFDVQGKPHRFIIEGEGNYDINKIAKDTAKIVQAAYDIFGELPYNDYTFILNTRGGGGLEHLNSTALQFNKLGFTTNYMSFMTLVAHEYFHCFNVKRIRPDALGPFNYEGENYTKLLWVAEGGTAYYENILVRRAGLTTEKEFLGNAASQIQALQDRPGRFETSVEEASFDAWIKYYRPDENAVNNQISYYDKGEIVNFLLDLQIRKDSNGAKSLDDVMRYLYNEHYKKNKNYTPEDYQKISEMMAGKSLEDFFKRFVRGRDELDYNAALNAFGLNLYVNNGKSNAYIGATLRQDGEKLNITALPNNTPAYEQGLNVNDQIVAIDGLRVNLTFLNSYLSEKKAGDKVKLTVFRFDELREFEIILGGKSAATYRIAAVEGATEAQKALYLNYFGKELK
jgi:predicted metalloprotease with PDZ domain